MDSKRLRLNIIGDCDDNDADGDDNDSDRNDDGLDRRIAVSPSSTESALPDDPRFGAASPEMCTASPEDNIDRLLGEYSVNVSADAVSTSTVTVPADFSDKRFCEAFLDVPSGGICGAALGESTVSTYVNQKLSENITETLDQLLERQPAMSSALSVELWHESYLNADGANILPVNICINEQTLHGSNVNMEVNENPISVEDNLDQAIIDISFTEELGVTVNQLMEETGDASKELDRINPGGSVSPHEALTVEDKTAAPDPMESWFETEGFGWQFPEELDDWFDATESPTEFFLEDYTDDRTSPINMEEPQPVPHPSEKPLYAGAPITIGESAVAILTFVLNTHASGQDLAKVLELIQLHLPPSNDFLPTPFLFYKHFEHAEAPLISIYFCDACHGKLDSADSKCDRCGPDSKAAFYINSPVLPQIQNLYKKTGFLDLISYRHTRKKSVEGNLEDIYDGELYKEASEKYLSENPYNLSLTWNTDGISLYKSSNYQVWPLFLSINELPPHLRGKPEYMLLAGLAFGPTKPTPNLLLYPVYQEFQTLSSGFEVFLPGAEDPIQVKCRIICGTCDGPARSLFLRMAGHAGYYACPKCLSQGEHNEGTEYVTVYPYEENLVERTEENYKEHLALVRETKKPQHGILGPSLMQQLVSTFFIYSTAIDPMHAVNLGVTRQLLSLWFNSAFVKSVFGAEATIKDICAKLSALMVAIKPPYFVQRCPRSFAHLKYFKASELRSFLFHYALPVLHKHMTSKYFEHFKLFVVSVYLLNSDSISPDDIALSQVLLNKFVEDFEVLYGKRYMSFNLHCLRHLAKTVSLLGPLWSFSCFSFENLNGLLAKLVHGTRYAGLQIHSNLWILSCLPELINKLEPGKVKMFCQGLSRNHRYVLSESIAEGIYVVGEMTKTHILHPLLLCALSQSDVVGSNFTFYLKLELNHYLYVAENYDRGFLKNSASVLYYVDGVKHFGTLKIFLRVTCCNCSVVCLCPAEHCALISRAKVQNCFVIDALQLPISHCVLVESEDTNIDVVSISALKGVVFKVQVDDQVFFSVPPNHQELE